jgi:hypothetical protein
MRTYGVGVDVPRPPPRPAEPEPNQPEPRGVVSGRLAAPERTTSPIQPAQEHAKTQPEPEPIRTTQHQPDPNPDQASPNQTRREAKREGGGSRCMETFPVSGRQQAGKGAPPTTRTHQTASRNVSALLLLPRGRVLFGSFFSVRALKNNLHGLCVSRS